MAGVYGNLLTVVLNQAKLHPQLRNLIAVKNTTHQNFPQKWKNIINFRVEHQQTQKFISPSLSNVPDKCSTKACFSPSVLNILLMHQQMHRYNSCLFSKFPSSRNQQILPFFEGKLQKRSVCTLCWHQTVPKRDFCCQHLTLSCLFCLPGSPNPVPVASSSVSHSVQRSKFTSAIEKTASGEEEEDTIKTFETDAAWSIRLANENGYLSWCRNTYLTSALALGIHTAGRVASDNAELAAHGLFFLAGLNLFWGTASYIFYLFALRRRAHLSLLTGVSQTVYALLHMALWFMACTVYLSGDALSDP